MPSCACEMLVTFSDTSYLLVLARGLLVVVECLFLVASYLVLSSNYLLDCFMIFQLLS